MLSPDGEAFISEQIVLLKEGLIQAIDSTLSFSDQVSIIDGMGKYLIPGLTDAQACQLLARKLHEGGVKIMAGIDANLPLPTVPGFYLHDELVSLRNVGLSNAEVLRTATATPSTWLQKNTG